MSKQQLAEDAEFAAIQTVFEALNRLKPDSRQRVVEYVTARLEISTLREDRTESTPRKIGEYENTSRPEKKALLQAPLGTFAEFFDVARPKHHPTRALVAAYWLQVCKGASNFNSFSINKALKDLGHGIPNITVAIDSLKRKKPALVVQLTKGGKSRQARKTYKVTVAGSKAVEKMISG